MSASLDEGQLAELRTKVKAMKGLPRPEQRRDLRLAANVSLREIAAVVGVSTTAVAYWEAGVKTPRGNHLTAYAAILQVLGEPQ